MRSVLRPLFPGIVWWLALLIPLVGLGFYATYFSRFLATTGLLHVHFAVSLLWVVLLVVQPLLLFRNKTALHRLAGKAGYVIIPAVVLTTWLVIARVSSTLLLSESELSLFQRQSLFIPLVFLFWLVLFYVLGMVFRRQAVEHATYLFSSALTLLGPTLDRILFQVYQYFGIGFNVFAEFFTFVVIDVILCALLIYQSKKGYSLRAVTVSILIYLAGQAAYVFVPPSDAWEALLRFLFDSKVHG